MKVLISGSRHYTDYSEFEAALDGIVFTRIIHGAARGADTLAGEYAKRHGIPVDVYPALWDKHGKAAGPIRNAQMLKEGQPDLVIAFKGPNSRGTQNMIDQAMKAGIETRIISI